MSSEVRNTRAGSSACQNAGVRGRREPGLLADAIAGFLKESGLGRGDANAQGFAAWSRSLGPELSRRARPVAFHGGELRVEVDSAAHLHELQNFTGERHRGSANGLLGEERIRRVVYKLARRT